MRVVEQEHRLLKKVVEFPSSEIFKTQLVVALSNLFHLTLL